MLHELGRALAAMTLTDGEVGIDMRGAGVLGDRATYEPSRIRHPHGEAWIAAAGPAVTLTVATIYGWPGWAAARSRS